MENDKASVQKVNYPPLPPDGSLGEEVDAGGRPGLYTSAADGMVDVVVPLDDIPGGKSNWRQVIAAVGRCGWQDEKLRLIELEKGKVVKHEKPGQFLPLDVALAVLKCDENAEAWRQWGQKR